jgi:hypothetical protein
MNKERQVCARRRAGRVPVIAVSDVVRSELGVIYGGEKSVATQAVHLLEVTTDSAPMRAIS